MHLHFLTYASLHSNFVILPRDIAPSLLRAPLPAGIGQCRYVDTILDAEIDAAFARLERFMNANPETMWNPSKSFAAAYAEEE